MPNVNEYSSGPFKVVEQHFTDPDGTHWYDLQMILTGHVRVPSTGGADRAAQLKAERSILRGMVDDIQHALNDEDES